jgi:LAO/AO transport system kinase
VARRADTAGILAGNRISIARAITLVENEDPEAEPLLRTLFPRTGNASRIGITGPPGAGKSTLTTRLVSAFRQEGKRVGVIAVDPTSPFTGGAVLGDRVRMSDVELDSGVFIRSMASRGNPGGLSKSAGEAADILDAAGMDIILFETVGVGQSELDIARAADVTVVVLVPESGDAVQAMKAGLMEIADLFVMNKADRPGAELAVQAITSSLTLRQSATPLPEVLQTVAHEGKGVGEVVDAIRRFRERMDADGGTQRRRRERMTTRIADLVVSRVRRQFWTPERREELMSSVEAVLRGESTPYDVAHRLIDSIGSAS